MICIAEDRSAEEVGVRLLLQSLARWCPAEPTTLWFPPAGEEFERWLAGFPAVTLIKTPLGPGGWNIKPIALLYALGTGAHEAWWIDSDVIVTEDFLHRYRNVESKHFIVAEEALYGNAEDGGLRAKAWGYAVERVLPFCLNSCVLRATHSHVALLEYWAAQMNTSAYLEAQVAPISARPRHLLGDQDALTACLSGPLSTVPLFFLYRGADIIQYFGPAGYSPSERLYNLWHGLPPFIHSQGPLKPWRIIKTNKKRGARQLFDALYAELSPYKAAALRYSPHARSMFPRNKHCPIWLGIAFKIIGLGNIPLTGLPLACGYSLNRVASQIVQNMRKRSNTG